MAAPTTTLPVDRPVLLRRALRLELLTLGWNAVEAVLALAAAVAAGSVALMGFGADSVIECASAGILLWRLCAERAGTDSAAVEALDLRAHRLVGLTLFALAVYVAGDSAWCLWRGDRPRPSLPGIAVTGLSIGVMVWLARAKRRTGSALGSRALAADSFQTTACWWLSIVSLAGLVLNSTLGWWWADPVAALAMTPLLVQEGRQAWRRDPCGC